MSHRVRLVVDAEEDLFELCRYVAEHASRESAGRLLDRLEEACRSLAELPERGHLPPELDRIGVATYRILKRLPKELKGQLPGPEEIAKLLEDV